MELDLRLLTEAEAGPGNSELVEQEENEELLCLPVLERIVKFDRIPNTKYIRILKIHRIPNTEYIRFLKNERIRIPNSAIRT